MPRKLIDVIEHKDMVDEVYLEEDGTYFHDIYYKEEKTGFEQHRCAAKLNYSIRLRCK